jgi:hypothetical protein
MSADSVPSSSKTNIFQRKLIYCRHFRIYSRCAMFDWSDTVFRWRNLTRRRISITILQPRYWGREADSPEVCRLTLNRTDTRDPSDFFLDIKQKNPRGHEYQTRLTRLLDVSSHNQNGPLPKRTTLKRTITKTDYQNKICIARIFIYFFFDFVFIVCFLNLS